MTYYLSYIEVHHHAALMLSTQESPEQPTRIICEVGFAYSPNLNDEQVGYFSTHKGHVREETNISKALYSSLSVRHRTYEISEFEVKKFFEIINRSKQINAETVDVEFKDEEEITKQTEIVGGPQYQKLRYNCKNYAIDVMKEMGIVDAKRLSNFFIQIPNDENLEDISKIELSCPIKDKFIQEAIPTLEKTINELMFILENIDAIQVNPLNNKESDLEEKLELETDEYNKHSYQTAITQALKIAHHLYETPQKAGVDPNFDTKFTALGRLLNYIITFEDKAAITTSPSKLKKSIFNKSIAALEELDDSLSDLQNQAQDINQLTQDDCLEFFWKSTPPLTERLDLGNFTDEEKSIYVIKIKSKEMNDGLDNLLHVLQSRLLHDSTLTEDFSSDLINLSLLITNAKNEIEKYNNQFFKEIEESKESKDHSKVVSSCVVSQKNNLDTILLKLAKSINDFTPKSPKSNKFMRFVHYLIGYFKKDYFTKGKSAKKILTNKLNKIIKSTQKYEKSRLFKPKQSALDAKVKPSVRNTRPKS